MHVASCTRPKEGIQSVLCFLGGKGCPFHRLQASVVFVAAQGTAFHFTFPSHRTLVKKYQVWALPSTERENHLGSDYE